MSKGYMQSIFYYALTFAVRMYQYVHLRFHDLKHSKITYWNDCCSHITLIQTFLSALLERIYQNTFAPLVARFPLFLKKKISSVQRPQGAKINFLANPAINFVRYTFHTYLFVFFVISPLISHAGVNIGEPQQHKLRPKGSEVVLISFKVIECFRTKKEAFAVLDRASSLVKHPSCGEGLAHVLMQRQESMISGEDKTFLDVIQIPYIINQPKIYIDKGHFKVKPIMEKQMIEQKGEVVIGLSKIIQGHIKATIAASFEKVSMNDYLAHYERDQTFVNQIPVKRNRIMTTSETFKLGEMKIISGGMWVEGVKKNNDVLPEYSRLWLELVIK